MALLSVAIFALVACVGFPVELELHHTVTGCHLPQCWQRSVVVSALSSINTVNRHRARLLLGWVTARGHAGQVNRLGM